MKEPSKDISAVFRENEYKLHEPPSPKSWHRLERKLDAHRRRNRVSLYRSLAMVAGVLILVVMITLFSLVASRQFNLLSDRPASIESLPPAEGELKARQIVSYSKVYADLATNPVTEGERDRRLVPAAGK